MRTSHFLVLTPFISIACDTAPPCGVGTTAIDGVCTPDDPGGEGGGSEQGGGSGTGGAMGTDRYEVGRTNVPPP